MSETRGGYSAIPMTIIDDPDLSIHAKMTYAAIASYAGCAAIFPSHETLATKASCSVTAVQRALRDLRRKGWINWEIRATKTGKRCFYHIHVPGVEGPVSQTAPPGGSGPSDRTGPVSETDEVDRDEVDRAKDRARKNEKTGNDDSGQDTDLLGDPVPDPKKSPTAMQVAFEEWWGVYPKKVARGAAERHYRSARRIASKRALLDGATAYAEFVKKKGWKPDFIASPDNWLRNKRWADELDDEPQEQEYRSSEW